MVCFWMSRFFNIEIIIISSLPWWQLLDSPDWRHHFWGIRRTHLSTIPNWITLWLFNIAMKQCTFIDDKHDDLSIKLGNFPVRKLWTMLHLLDPFGLLNTAMEHGRFLDRSHDVMMCLLICIRLVIFRMSIGQHWVQYPNNKMITLW